MTQKEFVKRLPAFFIAAVVGSALVALSPGPAAASCGIVPAVGNALVSSDVVFVGTVTALENEDRWATVQVDEVWKGKDVPPEVEVRAGPKDPPGPAGVATSVDRTYVLGRQYLFFPYRDRPDFYRDNACSATTRFGPHLTKFRPAALDVSPTPSSPSEEASPTAADRHEDDPGSESSPLVIVFAGLAAIGVLAALWRFLAK